MSWISDLESLASVGLSEADIAKAVADSPEIRAEVIRMAELARDTWREIWDESGDHPYQTGAYRESLQITYTTKPDEFSATVRSNRPEAKWLEYGTVKMREFAPAQKTIDRLNGDQSGATSKKSGGGHVGSIGG
jgi:hypothetical protein